MTKKKPETFQICSSMPAPRAWVFSNDWMKEDWDEDKIRPNEMEQDAKFIRNGDRQVEVAVLAFTAKHPDYNATDASKAIEEARIARVPEDILLKIWKKHNLTTIKNRTDYSRTLPKKKTP